MKGIDEAGFEKCMPVQEQTFVHSLKGKDVAVQSQTGTGKTAVFLITIFQHFVGEGPIKNKKALIIAPTRELAVQIEKEAKLLGKYLDITVGSFYGGVGYYHQEKLLEKDVDIIVATPGRLLDLSQKGLIDLKKIGYFVIDEADRLFDMGFLPDIRRLLMKMVPCTKRQTMLFSATLDSNTRNVAYESMNDPVKIEISPDQVTVDKITQEIYHVSRKEKINLMLGLMKKEMPKNALIFTNMKTTAALVAKHLEYNGYKCLHISGDLPQKKRLQIMENFKSGNLPFLVATDVAARGLHIDDLELIINYDIPGDCENYVHRIGRTARAGKSGKAIALACEDYVYNLEAIEAFIDMKIPIKYADDELFAENKGAGLVFDPRRNRGSKFKKKGDRHKSTVRSHKKPASFSQSRTSKEGKKMKFEDKKRKFEDKKVKPDDKKVRFEDKKVRPEDKKVRFEDKKGKFEDRKGKRTGPPRSKAYQKKNPKNQSSSQQPRKKGNMEDRLEYYKKKYGDNFKVSGEPAIKKSMAEKKSIFKKISGIFKGKKDKGKQR
jgi:ATP-dependent RNA helicase RhlB